MFGPDADSVVAPALSVIDELSAFFFCLRRKAFNRKAAKNCGEGRKENRMQPRKLFCSSRLRNRLRGTPHWQPENDVRACNSGPPGRFISPGFAPLRRINQLRARKGI
jgi:hypothetical protein